MGPHTQNLRGADAHYIHCLLTVCNTDDHCYVLIDRDIFLLEGLMFVTMLWSGVSQYRVLHMAPSVGSWRAETVG